MADSREIYVLGAGGHAKVVIATLKAAGYTVEQVLDDNTERHGEKILEIPISGPLSLLDKNKSCNAVIAVGDNQTRRKIAGKFPSITWATIVHPSATVDPTATIGPGAVVFAGAIIQPDAVIGAHAIVNTGATIDHDCHIGDYVHVAPGCHLCGEVNVGEGALLGVGSVVIPGINIGARTTVGAGSVVVHDLPPDIKAAGMPAKPTA